MELFKDFIRVVFGAPDGDAPVSDASAYILLSLMVVVITLTILIKWEVI
jgi:hypothetical protein